MILIIPPSNFIRLDAIFEIHIYIGLLYIILGLIGGSIGFGLSIIMRLELALPGFIACPPLQYNWFN